MQSKHLLKYRNCDRGSFIKSVKAPLLDTTVHAVDLLKLDTHMIRIQVTFGLLIQNFRADLTCYNSYLLTLATLHSQNSSKDLGMIMHD